MGLHQPVAVENVLVWSGGETVKVQGVERTGIDVMKMGGGRRWRGTTAYAT